jgi:hypothetical protein
VAGDEVNEISVERHLGQNLTRATGYGPGVTVASSPATSRGGRLRLIGTLRDPAVIRKILAHVGMAPSGPRPGPAPPESGAAAP